MAVIINERDKILQAAPERTITIIIPGNQIPASLLGIKMTPANAIFKSSADGSTGEPSSIVFTLTRTYVTNAATWTVTAGTATLTGTGDSRTLTFANFSTNSATIRATVTQAGNTYIAEASVVKVKDGTNGTNGTNGAAGTRGTVNLYVLVGSGVSTWSDATANAAILSATGSSTRYAGDTVTQYNNNGFAETRFWNGILPTGAWITGQILNGNLLVTGTLTADKIGAGSFSGRTFTGGTFTGALFQTASSGANRIALDSATNSFTMTSSAGGTTTMSPSDGNYFVAGSAKPAITALGNAIYPGVYGVSVTGGIPGITAQGPTVSLQCNTGFKWGSVPYYPVPPNTARRFLCDDGTWKVALLPASTTGSAGSLVGYITVYLADGISQVKIPAYNL